MKHTWKLRLASGALAMMLALGPPVGAQDDPASAALRAHFPELHDAIWSIPTADNATKQGIVALWQTAIEMAAPDVAGEALARIFGVSMNDLLADLVADPGAAAALSLDKFGTGLAEDAAVSASAALLADLLLSIPAAQDMSPEFRTVLAALIRSIVEESYFVFKGLKDPSEVVSGLVNRAFDIYEIAVATGEAVDAQRSALVASAQAVELAAQLADEVATDVARQRAMEIVTDTQDIVADMVGRDDAEAVREIVNLTFIALLSQRRGDVERARSLAQRILDMGAEADNIGPFSAMLRPVDWLTAIGREDFRDAPSEAAFVMVSTTGLRFLFAPEDGAVDPPPAGPVTPDPAEPHEPTAGSAIWGPDIVVAEYPGFSPCGELDGDPACLRGLGYSEQAAAFAFGLDGDYAGMSRGIEFRELGAVDLGLAEVVGASSWNVSVLLNGTPDYQVVEATLDLWQQFRDDTSQAMLVQYPQASTRDSFIRSHRRLADGTQRFVLMETVTDQCRACDILGSAVTFLDIGPATGGQVVRRPIGLLLGDPDDMEDMTAEVLLRRPASLQVRLNSFGYEAGPMDGYPGPGTREALMDFQVDHCLPPTGEPDADTRAALMAADDFTSPCAGAVRPPGITANAPLFTGIYVDDSALCALDAVPYEIVFQSQITISAGSHMWGWEDPCETGRSDIRGEATLFRGTCYVGNEVFDGRWTFDLLSNDAFRFLGMDGTDPARSFSRCADDSRLAGVRGEVSEVANVDFQPAGGNQGLIPGLELGIYVSDPAYCVGLGEVSNPDMIRVIEEGSAVFGFEEACLVTFVEGDRDGLLIEGTCSLGQESTSGLNWVWNPESTTSFVEIRSIFKNSAEAPWGQRFTMCSEGGSAESETALVLTDEVAESDTEGKMAELALGTYVTDPRFCTDPGAAAFGRDIRMIDGAQVDHGLNDPCSYNAPVADGGALEYTGHCPFSDPGYVPNWRWRPLSSTAFVEERGFFPNTPDMPWGQQFTRCPEASPAETGHSGGIQPMDPERPPWWTDGLVLTGQGAQDSGSSWSIEISVDAEGSATIRYPSLACGGRLALMGYDTGGVELIESITENRSRCTDGGSVRITPTIDADSFSFAWEKDGQGAEGTLRASIDEPVTTTTVSPPLDATLMMNQPDWWLPGTTWAGTVAAQGGIEWDLEVEVLPDGTARITYPWLGCAGILTLRQISGIHAVLSEVIEGGDDCREGGRIMLAPVSADIFSFAWTDGNGGIASGRVGRNGFAVMSAAAVATDAAADASAAAAAMVTAAMEAAAAAPPGSCRSVTATIVSDVSLGPPVGQDLPTCNMCELTAVDFNGPLERPGHSYDYLWDGQCPNGMIGGAGILRAFEDGRDNFELEVGGSESGYQVVNGRFVLDTSRALVSVTLGRRGERADDCGVNPNRLDIYGIVRDGVQLQSAEVARSLLEKAKNTIVARCPDLVGADYEVDLLFESDVPQIGSLDEIVIQGGRGASYARAACDGDELSLNAPCRYNGGSYAQSYASRLGEAASDRLRAVEEAQEAEASVRREEDRRRALEAVLGPIRRSAEQFLETGTGSLADLAAAADTDGMATMILLEGGITLGLPAPDGNFDLVEADGQRLVQITYRRDSPLAAAERGFLAENNQSWDDWNRLVDLAVPRIIQITCLYASAAVVPRSASEVTATLRDFSSDSSNISIILDCQ